MMIHCVRLVVADTEDSHVEVLHCTRTAWVAADIPRPDSAGVAAVPNLIFLQPIHTNRYNVCVLRERGGGENLCGACVATDRQKRGHIYLNPHMLNKLPSVTHV